MLSWLLRKHFEYEVGGFEEQDGLILSTAANTVLTSAERIRATARLSGTARSGEATDATS